MNTLSNIGDEVTLVSIAGYRDGAVLVTQKAVITGIAEFDEAWASVEYTSTDDPRGAATIGRTFITIRDDERRAASNDDMVARFKSEFASKVEA